MSEHFARYFAELGVDTISCVGLSDAERRVNEDRPDAVVCDYDLLAAIPQATWTNESVLSGAQIIAVSLTRRSSEAHLPDGKNIAGFLYLPASQSGETRRILAAVRQGTTGINPPSVMTWPETTKVAQFQ